MDKIKKVKGIHNPYKKLCLAENEKVRVDTLKEVAKFFGTELKTRKRASTLVENVFCKNEELKELLQKNSISPEENKKIQEQIEKDIENLQKDIGYKANADKVKETKKKEYKSFTGMNLRKNFKDKALIPMGKGAANFAKAHKVKLAVVAGIVAYASYSSIASLDDLENMNSMAADSVMEYQDNKPGNILEMPKTLEGDDYARFVENVSSLTLTRALKMDINASEFKDFDRLYGQYMAQLQKRESGHNGIELTQEEGRTFLVMQYIATNTYIDFLKDKSETLKGSSLEKNEYKIARYKNQLNSIEKASNDMKAGKEGNLERKIKSGEDYFTYYTDLGGFHVDGLDQKVFKY